MKRKEMKKKKKQMKRKREKKEKANLCKVSISFSKIFQNRKFY